MTFLALRPSDRPAIIAGTTGEQTSFQGLLELGRAFASRLGAPKQLVLISCRNDPFTAISYAGAVLAGHAVALVDARGPIGLSAQLIQAYRPEWLVGPAGLGFQVEAEGLTVDSVIPLEGGELVRTAYRRQARVHPDLAVVLSTSGTTGSRKVVRLSVRNVNSNAESIASFLSLTADERPVTSLPLSYSFGLSVVNSHWLAGAAVVLTDESVIQPTFLRTFDDNRCTSLAGVPFTYQMLEKIGFRRMALPSLRTLQQAGGALDRQLTRLYAEFMTSRGGRLFVMYGQTEATARMAYVPPERLMEKIGSAGIAIPGGRITVDREADEAGATTTTGEIVYEGPNVMMGYASSRTELSLGDALGGRLRTGDLGYLDDEGFLFLVGRSKRIAKVYGLRVNLDEIEAMVRANGPAAVAGGRDTIWAFCSFGSDESVAGLGRSIAASLKLHHSAVRFRHVDTIPTTPAGKVDYRQIETWIESER